MPFGMEHPYREHSTYGVTTLSAAERFIKHCENAASAATGSIPEYQAVNVSEMRIAAKALEAAFLRGGSFYDIQSMKQVSNEILEQGERLQRHMPFKYVREDDPVKRRYVEGTLAMKAMEWLHEKSLDLVQLATQRNMPVHLKAVQVELCWHILELCEQGTNVIAYARRSD